MDDNPVDKIIARLVTALFEIREGAAFSVRIPESGHALDYEQIAEVAAQAIEWTPGESLEMVLLRIFDEVDTNS